MPRCPQIHCILPALPSTHSLFLCLQAPTHGYDPSAFICNFAKPPWGLPASSLCPAIASSHHGMSRTVVNLGFALLLPCLRSLVVPRVLRKKPRLPGVALRDQLSSAGSAHASWLCTGESVFLPFLLRLRLPRGSLWLSPPRKLFSHHFIQLLHYYCHGTSVTSAWSGLPSSPTPRTELLPGGAYSIL